MNKKTYIQPSTSVVNLKIGQLMLSGSMSQTEYNGHAGSRGRNKWTEDDEE